MLLRQKFTAVFFLFAFLGMCMSLQAQDSLWVSLVKETQKIAALQSVYVDNSYIHSYNNRLGIWVKVKNRGELEALSRQYSIDTQDVDTINAYPSLDGGRGSYVFFPFSPSYLKELENAGIERYTVESRQGEFIWPILGVRITSRIGRRWGRFHSGIDIAATIGTPVVAARDGVVSGSSFRRGYGITVQLTHDNDSITRYAHLDAALVREGDVVVKGQLIGYSGNTGRSTGPHLHFEVQCGGIILDPEKFLPGFEQSMESAWEFKSFLQEKVN